MKDMEGEEHIARVRSEMLYDIISIIMYTKDDEERAREVICKLNQHSDLWPSEKEALAVMKQVTDKLSLDSRTVSEWGDIRAGAKATGRLMRQFANLPLGVALLSRLDAFIPKSKQDRFFLDQLEGIQRKLKGSEAAEAKRGDIAKCVEFFSSQKRELLSLCSNFTCDNENQQKTLIDGCADVLDSVVDLIGVHYASLFDTRLRELLALAVKISTDKGDTTEAYVDDLVKSVRSAAPSAEDREIVNWA